MALKDELLDNLSDGNRQDEQAVIICLQFSIGKLKEKKAREAIVDLDDIFHTIIEASHLGTYQGHEFFVGPDDESVKFYIYGQDASKIYNGIKPVLSFLPNLPGSYIIKRYSTILEDHMHISS